MHQKPQQELVRIGSSAIGFHRPERVCPGGSQARYAGFRGLRGKRGTNPQQMPGVIRRWSPPLKQVRPTLDTLRLEIAMSRIMLICALAALLAAGSTQSASAVESANQTAWSQARLACADVGIARAAAPSVNVSPISTTPCGTRRRSLSADRGERRSIASECRAFRNKVWPDVCARRRGNENAA